jgi:mutator protein MutT
MADRLPAFADHYVGVGGIMVNDKEEVLMIQERRSAGEGDSKPWKFPGGYVDKGETVKQGVEREVLEETGVRGEFQGILAMREQLDYKYGAADFYIVCLLRPHPTSQEVNIQDTQEVSAAKWIPLSEISTNEDGCKFKLFPNAF